MEKKEKRFKFYNELTLSYEESCVHNIQPLELMQSIIKDKEIPQESILEMSYKLDERWSDSLNAKTEMIDIFIRYLTVDLEKLQQMDKKSRTEFVLKSLEYPEVQIKRIVESID